MVVVKRKPIDIEPELVHHGIKGQQWGKRNGPPYPLGYSDHSAVEKKRNSKSALSGETWRKLGKAAVMTAGVAAIGGMSYAAIKSGALDEVIETGKAFADQVTSATLNKNALGKSLKDIDEKMVAQINAENHSTYNGGLNCFHTSTSYILNSLFGMDTKALGFSGIDEASGLTIPGRHKNLFKTIFNGIEIEDVQDVPNDEVFKNLKSGSTGVLRLGGSNGGHFLNYEKDKNGNVTIVDGQLTKNRIVDGVKYLNMMNKYDISVLDVIDFSNASLRDGADEILRHIVK